MVSDPEQIQDQLTRLASIFPVEAEQFITQRLRKLITQLSGSQGWRLAGSIMVPLWPLFFNALVFADQFHHFVGG